MTPTLQFYSYPLSPPCDAVRIALKEKGLAHTLIAVDLPGAQNRSADFRSLNYLGRVPVLRHGDLTLFESHAILEYLEEMFPSPALLPADLPTRARARMWMAVLASEWHGLRRTLYHEGLLKPLKMLPGPADRNLLMEARKVAAPHFDAMELQLEKNQQVSGEGYLVGSYSLADVAFTPTLYVLKKADLLPRKYPLLTAWSTRCLGRPSAPSWLEKPGYLR